MKSKTSKRDDVSPAAPKVKSRTSHDPGAKLLKEHIAIAACYRAQSRGFAPGKEINDWLEAEAERLKQTAG